MRIMDEVDVAIVGGGVAGSAAALTLCRYTAHSAAVFERSDYTQARPGEHLSISAVPLLEYLGIEVASIMSGHVAGGRPFCAWHGETLERRNPVFGGALHGWSVDRSQFDQALAREAERRGALLLTRRRVTDASYSQDERRWYVHVEHDFGKTTWRARALIDASGTRSIMGRLQGMSFVVDDALYASVARVGRDRDLDGSLIVEAAADGWWYAAPVPGDARVIAFITDVRTMRQKRPYQAERWHALASDTRHIVQLIRSLPTKIDTYFVPSRRLSSPVGETWVAAGDAAMATDPLASMGIGFALQSGAAAAGVVSGALERDPVPGLRYADSIATTFERYSMMRRTFYADAARSIRNSFWLLRGTAG